MTDFLTALKSEPLLTDGAMGSYLFELTGRLSEANHVYEAFNVDQPELIRRVHGDYLAAGARCLKTNTFGANRRQLQPFGLEGRIAGLNRAGVDIARSSATGFSAEQIFVLASVGPTTELLTEAAAVEACYKEQIESLIAAGVDALLLETFSSQRQLELLIDLIRSLPHAPPIIAEMTFSAELVPSAFVKRMAEKGAALAGVNCCAPWDANAFVDAVRGAALPLSVMPNAGGFQRIGNRFLTAVNPEYAGKLARSFLDRGVRLIGGCCEMHPPHILEMNNYLRSRKASVMVTDIRQNKLPPAVDAEKKQNGVFSSKLKEGRFVVSVEMLPPRGTDERILAGKVEFLQQLAESGLADAVDITDGSRGIPLMPPGDFIQLTRARLGWTTDRLEMIAHFTTRDLNLMGLQSRLMGYHAQRIHNVLFITGDPPKMSPTYPRSTAVFDLDSIAMVRFTQAYLNAGADFGGAPLGKQADPRTHFTIGTGCEPEAADLKRELERLHQKIDNGADYVMTQPVFHEKPLAALDPFRARCPILVGVMIFSSLEQAQRLAQVPGVIVPDSIFERMGAYHNPSDQSKVGREIAAEQIRRVVRDGWRGIYLISPGTTAVTRQVLEAGLR